MHDLHSLRLAGVERSTALQEFYKEWRKDGLVVLKWLALVASSNVPGNLEAVKKLTTHEAFNIKNPNNCYSLFLGFCRSHPNFHAEDGSGYEFIADSILAVRIHDHLAGIYHETIGCAIDKVADMYLLQHILTNRNNLSA